MGEKKGDPCEDCGVPMAIAPALGAYCDNAECPEKKLPQEERVKLRMQRALQAFGPGKAAEPATPGATRQGAFNNRGEKND